MKYWLLATLLLVGCAKTELPISSGEYDDFFTVVTEKREILKREDGYNAGTIITRKVVERVSESTVRIHYQMVALDQYGKIISVAMCR